MNKLDRFEALAEQLVEGTFTRLFGGRLPPLKVAMHLARAMEDHHTRSPDGTAQAPTHYWVYVHPSDHKALAESEAAENESGEGECKELEKELAHHVAELAAKANLQLGTTPSVYILPDDNTAPHDVRIEARRMSEEASDVERTREIEPSDEVKAEAAATEAPRGRPFLILEGHRHVNLHEPVVSIGRALDNDVIIEDPRVSRHHAQLRQRYGHYVLYDVGSSGGTQINGYPVEECVLHSGDVISFAGIQVIYGEDPPTPIPLPEEEEHENTEPINPPEATQKE